MEAGWSLEIIDTNSMFILPVFFSVKLTLADDDSVPQINWGKLMALEIKMQTFLKVGLKKSLQVWCQPCAICLKRQINKLHTRSLEQSWRSSILEASHLIPSPAPWGSPGGRDRTNVLLPPVWSYLLSCLCWSVSDNSGPKKPPQNTVPQAPSERLVCRFITTESCSRAGCCLWAPWHPFSLTQTIKCSSLSV